VKERALGFQLGNPRQADACAVERGARAADGDPALLLPAYTFGNVGGRARRLHWRDAPDCCTVRRPYQLIAGARSANPQRAIESGRDLGLDPTRCCTDYRNRAETEGSTWPRTRGFLADLNLVGRQRRLYRPGGDSWSTNSN
jgi:hypothetical protein